MKKTRLIFIPGAHPTYMPLGIASLYSYLKKNSPGSDITAIDLNIKLWNYLFASASPASLVPSFFRGTVGNFFSRDIYTAYQKELSLFYSEFKRTEDELKKFLNSGEMNETVNWYREFLFEELAPAGNETFAISAMYPDQVVHMLAISALLKYEFPEVKIITGGAALTAIDIDELMDAAPFIDAFYRGEGEEGLHQYLSVNPTASIRGLSFRADGTNIHNPSPAAIPMSEIPVPDFSFCNFNDYLNPEPVLPVVFSRGCRWRRCSFCSHNFSFAGYRTSGYRELADKLAYYRDTHGVSHFYFADQYIGASDLLGISEAIINSGLDIRFHVMGRPTSDYSAEVLKTAFAAGCRWISWGVESGSGELLDICSKGTEPETVETVLFRASEAGISNLAMMIFGLPGTDSARFQETLDFAGRVTGYVDAFTSSSFQLFEGTPFFRNREILGLEPVAREVILQVNGKDIHSFRWDYLLKSDSPEDSIHPAQSEVRQWKQWKSWVRGGETFRETLGAEHYLLYSSREADSASDGPGKPTTPSRPEPFLPRTG